MTTHSQQRRVSVVIPVHNEEKILKSALDSLIQFCTANSISPEIIICENGSIDNTRKILENYPSMHVRKLFLDTRGLGAAYKQGIIEASTETIYFTGIDFPFGFENITDSLRYLDHYDMVFSSKAHPDSIIHAPFLRKIVSFIFRLIMRVFLPVTVRDPQGCLTAKSAVLKDVANFCDSTDAFFQTQTALYGGLLGYRIAEIPVNYIKPRFGSKFSIRKDSPKIFRQFLRERRLISEKLSSDKRSTANRRKSETIRKKI